MDRFLQKGIKSYMDRLKTLSSVRPCVTWWKAKWNCPVNGQIVNRRADITRSTWPVWALPTEKRILSHDQTGL